MLLQNKRMKKICWMVLIVALTSCQTTYYVVRHAEKATVPADNPSLTEAGQQRAETLKTLLLSKHIKAIYSSDYVRTKETARPLAEKLSLPIELYNPREQAAFIEQLKSSKKNSLIVGHSNTIRHIINGLYEHDTLQTDIDERIYDNLFVVTRKRFPTRQTTFEHRRY